MCKSWMCRRTTNETVAPVLPGKSALQIPFHLRLRAFHFPRRYLPLLLRCKRL